MSEGVSHKYEQATGPQSTLDQSQSNRP
jgi:hypothetical protein